MAAKAGKSAAKSAKNKGMSGKVGGLFRTLVTLSGVVLIAFLISSFMTARAMSGRWQPQESELSDKSLEMLADQISDKMQSGNPAQKPLLARETRLGLMKLGTKLAGAAAASVRLQVKDGGYKFEGNALGLGLVPLLYQGAASEDTLSGCLSGTLISAFPLVRVTCGDGSGRTLYFVMKNWPGEELKLLPIPFGNDALQERIEQLRRERLGTDTPTREQLEALDELLTLRLTREE